MPPPSISAADLVGDPQANKAELVREALNAIDRNYFNPVDTGDLLNAAWGGAVEAAQAAGTQMLPAKPDLYGNINAAFGRFTVAYQEIEARTSLSPTNLAYAAIRGMVAFIDNCHTYFLTPTQAATQRALNAGQDLIGPGLIRTRGYPWVITYVAPGGSAQQAGLREGDTILAYDGDSSPNAPASHAKDEGGTLVYTIKRSGEPAPREVTVTFSRYRLPHLESRIVAGNIGYLRFFSWEQGDAQANAIRDAIAGFERQGVKSWILDLRSNGGGYFTPIAGLFIPSGPILVQAPRGGSAFTVNADGRSITPERPLAILIGPGSGSASEIIPEAIRESGHAELIGEHTPGCMAGTVEVRLSDGSSIWVTTMHILVGSSGLDFEGAGVDPDIVAPQSADDLTSGRDPGLDAAVRYLRTLTEDAQPSETDQSSLAPPAFAGYQGAAVLCPGTA
jgi:carboxyl-terminal processing protease